MNFSTLSSGDIFHLLSFVLANFIAGGVIFSILEYWPGHRCNNQRSWWRNKSIICDLIYATLSPIFKISLRFIPSAVIFGFLLIFIPADKIYGYFMNGLGPLGTLSPIAQGITFFIISDFLLYWSHRSFHGTCLWPLHAIHHSPQDVDWTTAYRFHPLNLALGPWLVTTTMIFLGVSAKNIFLIAPLEVFMAYFVHANLNITLGPLRFIVATPVFHRWHHTCKSEGRASNFGANFSIWDVIFGTFYFPSAILPEHYGVENYDVRENYLCQLFFPFKMWGISACAMINAFINKRG